MNLWGDGPRTVVTNESSTGNEACDITADSVTVSDITFRTAPGGAGGNQTAVLVDGDGNRSIRVTVADADAHAFNVASGEANNSFTDCTVNDADNYAWYVVGPGTQVTASAVFASGQTSIVVWSTGDKSIFNNNWIDGGGDAIWIHVDAEYQAVTGNSSDEQIADRSGTSVVVGNVEW